MLALAAVALAERHGGPAMLFALLLGMPFNFLATDPRCAAGVDLAARSLLRIAVMLLGLRIAPADIAALGGSTALAVGALVAATMAAGLAVAPLLGRDWRLAVLTGGAVAICGASAALAIAAVLPRDARAERDTLFTVVAVTTLSTAAMIAYPPLFAALGFSDRATGVLIGATVHDVAQVVGAGYSVSDPAGDIATVVKLLRVAMLPAVLVLILAATARRGGGAALAPPWFLVGFVALAGANAAGLVPAVVADAAGEASRGLLVVAIAALGIKTSLRALALVGGGHLWLVVAETVALLLCAATFAALGLLG